MANGFFSIPTIANEPVKAYGAGSVERAELQAAYKKMFSEITEVPQYIGAEEIFSNNKKEIRPPHDHQKVVGYYHVGTQEDVKKAIEVALETRKTWSRTTWQERAAIFLKAADLIAGPYRAKINAATMIGQSKNAMQAEIDSACELIDFLRFNVKFMTEIYADQPISSPGVWNRVEYRPLEGFTFALTPFNFTAISGNLPTCMALMGNVVVWKPSDKQLLSAKVIMEVLKEAGLPDGVINMVLTGGAETAKTVIEHPDFSGIHFTGSTTVFRDIWKRIGDNINTHKTYPRIVGETGGKDFVMVHKSAKAKDVAIGLVRGAFEYQGQKCSAASRAYIPTNLWAEVEKEMKDMLSTVTVGTPEDFTNFVNAVIDEKAFDKISGYITRAKESAEVEVVYGGNFDKSKGYFIEPTVLKTTNPKYESMVEEIFGPVLTIYVYDEDKYEETLQLVDETSEYALTGSIYAMDADALQKAYVALENAAGNFYINDKPTGAVVGQQPFGGARASGTNDKAGSAMNLLRWTSVRTVKEQFVHPTDYKYPFLEK
ncbi:MULTISPECIES: L-glutamate gamma-semialdehyde dehydrogenase [Weeksella]|uniref:L-glutamate gamma-semialdehyde dehydrogenase n=1 Tax=Weeksella virosa (strain ATCC 43766 / DSM 16922 / JCM 21250 / CCUG 30538 / CDC 9751 / IAM 14551 / NBRC 16016 / NCTC 11634 / CL345/78) TaxID=865938 RepID=F0P0G4_WEEVC|nr:MULTISPECIES: L-glutamate gamma-semialdehyde dehydrogenase [Weeksella]ADX67448.1 delta-1-pyrroline-5-carboxylate dehydrogenase [Weeksella virosa DSM 16922]MDK7374324.1 L-glutamate gamma-semialdehyde dehydrogenase [Weeksella virosa]MDK7675729.1 L-glutamate gamma-semialdehyde dehydrogenase [Weeksella virosa]OFM82195.1 1-pyrroline-5-carboxylate dehydrogenase [Weeksella sp. HMSC059D05]SUP53741.1 1-pyrroline-5-carboxylate dehydrogenase 1 [Weeksella virosa]